MLRKIVIFGAFALIPAMGACELDPVDLDIHINDGWYDVVPQDGNGRPSDVGGDRTAPTGLNSRNR